MPRPNGKGGSRAGQRAGSDLDDYHVYYNIPDQAAEFLDLVLTPGAVAELEGHVRDCRPCLAYLNTYRKTRGLVGQAGRVEMPTEMRARLRRFLLDQLRAAPS